MWTMIRQITLLTSEGAPILLLSAGGKKPKLSAEHSSSVFYIMAGAITKRLTGPVCGARILNRPGPPLPTALVLRVALVRPQDVCRWLRRLPLFFISPEYTPLSVPAISLYHVHHVTYSVLYGELKGTSHVIWTIAHTRRTRGSPMHCRARQ